MIVASGIELRAGARLLLAEASFQVAEGDRIGLVGRNGAGKTTLTKVLAGDGQPAAGTVRRSGTVGYLPQDPRTGDLDVLALDRVLSARGLDELRAQMRKAEAQMSDADADVADQAIRRYGNLSDRLAVLGGYAAESEAAEPRRQPRAARPGAAPAAAHAVRRPAPAGRAGPDPVRRLADAAARRADQPPRRRLDRLAARPPQELPRRPDRRSATTSDLLEQVVNKVFYLDANRSVAGHLQRRLEGLPAAARDRRAAPPPGAGQRRAAGDRPAAAGRQDARQGDQGQGRAEHAPPR